EVWFEYLQQENDTSLSLLWQDMHYASTLTCYGLPFLGVLRCRVGEHKRWVLLFEPKGTSIASDAFRQTYKARYSDDNGFDIIVQLTRAVAYIHGRGLIHRHLNAESVFHMRLTHGRNAVSIGNLAAAGWPRGEDIEKSYARHSNILGLL